MEGTRRFSLDGDKGDAGLRQAVQKVTKVAKQKGAQSGRTVDMDPGLPKMSWQQLVKPGWNGLFSFTFNL